MECWSNGVMGRRISHFVRDDILLPRHFERSEKSFRKLLRENQL
jgi:hypothetical protein